MRKQLDIAGFAIPDHTPTLQLELAAADRISAQTGMRLTEHQLDESPHVLIGSVDRLVEKFEWLRAELGFSSFLVGEPGPLDAVVRRLSGSRDLPRSTASPNSAQDGTSYPVRPCAHSVSWVHPAHCGGVPPHRVP